MSRRLAGLFLPGQDGRRPVDGERIEAGDSPLWTEHVTFSEYFDGDTGEGLGATHQTGWTAPRRRAAFRMAGVEPDMVTRP